MTPLEVIRRYPAHDETLGSFLQSRVARRPEHPFIVFQGRTLGYAAFAAEVARAAAVLAARGVNAGDRVGVMMENHPVLAIAWHALARLGAIMVPVNPAFGAAEAGYVLKHAGVSGVLCAEAALEVVREACAALDAAPWLMLAERAAGGLQGFAESLPGAGEPPPPAARPDATCVLIYTSGTTGFPKGVMHSQRSVVLVGEAFVARMQLVPEDRLYCILPMFHLNALFYSLHGAIAAGATLVLEPRFSASSFWRNAAAAGVTQVNTIAAITNILIQRPRSEYDASHRIRKLYGAPISPEVYRAYREQFDVPVLIEGYGMSEIPGVLNNPFHAVKEGSAGPLAKHPDPARPFSEVIIADDAGRPVPDGTEGEFLVKTPVMMQGYFRDPEQTAAAFRDGWFLTGDLGRRDADGYFWFIARKKDIIRKRGENISGAELDRVIGEHPAVLQAAAIAVPAELGEDDILAAVVKREGAALDAQEVAAWCCARLAAIKVPRYVVFVDSLPVTATHRVEKFRLKADKGLRARATDLGVDAGRAGLQPPGAR